MATANTVHMPAFVSAQLHLHCVGQSTLHTLSTSVDSGKIWAIVLTWFHAPSVGGTKDRGWGEFFTQCMVLWKFLPRRDWKGRTGLSKYTDILDNPVYTEDELYLKPVTSWLLNYSSAQTLGQNRVHLYGSVHNKKLYCVGGSDNNTH